MARPALLLGFVVTVVAAAVGVSTSDVRSSEDLVSSVMDDCLSFDGLPMSCLRLKVLSYLDGLTGQQGRSLSAQQEEADAERLDAMIATRVQRFIKTHQFKVQLPEFLFQSAELTFRPGRDLGDFDIAFPEPNHAEERSISEARGMLKKKLLLPVLLLLKLKLKALTPIFVALVGIKALKALIMSKLALLLVVGFLVVQLCKKAGMPMPMSMEATPAPAPMPIPYGPPPTAPGNQYGSPSSSYEPTWDPSAGGNGNGNGNGANGNGNGHPYARVWDPHQVAYSAYYQQQQQQPQATATTTHA